MINANVDNPCRACANRDRLRKTLQAKVAIRQREIESLFRDIQTVPVDELPKVASEVERLFGRAGVNR